MYKDFAGADDPEKYSIIDEFGRSGVAGRAIVPIFERDPDTKRFAPTGTGFFVAKNLIITARHVFEHLFELKRSYAWDGSDPDAIEAAQIYQQFIIQQSSKGGEEIRQIRAAAVSPSADLALAQVGMLNLDQPCLPLSAKMPSVGDKVFTYAYPGAVVKEDSEQEIWIKGDYFPGHVREVLDNGIGTMTPWRNFHVDFHIHGGASGGPVFDSDGNVVGINCTSFQGQTDFAFVTAITADRELSLEGVEYKGNLNETVSIERLIKDSKHRV